jgi:hypothetical protein
VIRRLFLVALAMIIGCAAFLGASFATAAPGGPDLPAWLPAAALGKVDISSQQQIEINNLIPSVEADRYGITPGSFNNVRLLANTKLGSLYVIPGRSGVCLALAQAVACADLSGSVERVPAALLISNDSGQLIGGGLVSNAGFAVAAVRSGGARTAAATTVGGFTFSSAAGLRRGQTIQVEAS